MLEWSIILVIREFFAIEENLRISTPQGFNDTQGNGETRNIKTIHH
jgi:hypothetical protein